MNDPDQPLDPAAAQVIVKMKRLMLVSGLATFIGIATVLGVIGYRVFNGEGSSAAPPDVTASLPKGARITGTVVVGDRIVVMLDVAGASEVRSFDLRTMKPAGRLRFAPEP